MPSCTFLRDQDEHARVTRLCVTLMFNYCDQRDKVNVCLTLTRTGARFVYCLSMFWNCAKGKKMPFFFDYIICLLKELILPMFAGSPFNVRNDTTSIFSKISEHSFQNRYLCNLTSHGIISCWGSHHPVNPTLSWPLTFYELCHGNDEFVAETALISALAHDGVPILYRRIMKLLIDSPRQSPIANASDGGTLKV